MFWILFTGFCYLTDIKQYNITAHIDHPKRTIENSFIFKIENCTFTWHVVFSMERVNGSGRLPLYQKK